MLKGYPGETTTLRTMAADVVTEPEYFEYPGVTACLPGDEPHLLAETARNPFPPGVSVMAIARALREGWIKDPGLAKRARAYVDAYQKQLGQPFYDGRMQNVLPDGIGVNEHQRVTRGDPWPFDDQ
jgi:hypothetical protein